VTPHAADAEKKGSCGATLDGARLLSRKRKPEKLVKGTKRKESMIMSRLSMLRTMLSTGEGVNALNRCIQHKRW